MSELTFDQYNAIVDDFVENILEPNTSALDIRFELKSDAQTIDDWLCPESAKHLKQFSRAANHSTGSSHPLDRERWFEFIWSVYRNHDDLGTDNLQRWLLEEEEWTPAVARELVIEDFSVVFVTKWDWALAELKRPN